MKLAVIGNIPEPTGGAEVMLREFFRIFLAKPGHSASLLRWRLQFFYYFPEFVKKVYAQPGAVTQKGKLKIYYLFESFLRDNYERRSAYTHRLFDAYRAQSAIGAALLSKENPDLVHAHMLFPNSFFASEIAKILGLPWMVSIHGMLEFRLLDRFDRRFPQGHWRELFTKILREASRVTVVSGELVSECKRRGIHRVVKIPSGVDTQFFKPNNKETRQNILFLGSVRQDKGALLLLQAFERVRHDVSGHLVFLGNNLLKTKQLKHWQKDPRIKFLGTQSRERVRSELRKSKLMVLPSVSEGFPLSVLEAMSCQTPVLVTSVGGLKSLIQEGKNGFILKRRTVPQLANALVMIGRNGGSRKMGDEARKTAGKFDLRRVVSKYERHYQDVLRGWKGAARK